METPARGFPRGPIRVSDAERDAAVAELSQHYQTGRLTVDEFNDRSGRARRSRPRPHVRRHKGNRPVYRTTDIGSD